jgi:hypothetical protein
MTHHARYLSRFQLFELRPRRNSILTPAADDHAWFWGPCLDLSAEDATRNGDSYGLFGVVVQLLESKLRLVEGEEKYGSVVRDQNIPDRVTAKVRRLASRIMRGRL